MSCFVNVAANEGRKRGLMGPTETLAMTARSQQDYFPSVVSDAYHCSWRLLPIFLIRIRVTLLFYCDFHDGRAHFLSQVKFLYRCTSILCLAIDWACSAHAVQVVA